jgi:hypothetical protein
MAKKKAGKPKMPSTTTPAETEMRHIQIQLPDDAYQRGKQLAKENGLSLAAYVRQAVLQRIRDDAGKRTGA